jgi:hypothetical protein
MAWFLAEPPILMSSLFRLFFFLLLLVPKRPKGVMTSFAAMTDATVGISGLINITDKDRYLSYLPVAHGMERWLGEVS